MHVNADQLLKPSAFTARADGLSSWVTLSLFRGLPIHLFMHSTRCVTVCWLTAFLSTRSKNTFQAQNINEVAISAKIIPVPFTLASFSNGGAWLRVGKGWPPWGVFIIETLKWPNRPPTRLPTSLTQTTHITNKVIRLLTSVHELTHKPPCFCNECP